MKKAYLTLDPPREPDGTLCRTGLRPLRARCASAG